jgi:hypothetical protein
VRRLEAIGYDGPYCVEVNYPEFRSMPVAEAAGRLTTTAQSWSERQQPDQRRNRADLGVVVGAMPEKSGIKPTTTPRSARNTR